VDEKIRLTEFVANGLTENLNGYLTAWLMLKELRLEKGKDAWLEKVGSKLIHKHHLW
jgi:hypothetical protein